MKKYLYIIMSLMAISMLEGCTKEPFGNITPFVGTWQVVSFQTQTFDATGKMLTDVTQTDIGDAEIKQDEEKSSFNPIFFDLKMGGFKPIATVLSAGAGSSGTNGRGVVYFSPDLANDRINFWAVGANVTISDVGTVVKFKNNELQLSAVSTFPISPTSPSTTATPTMQTMQTLIMKKR